ETGCDNGRACSCLSPQPRPRFRGNVLCMCVTHLHGELEALGWAGVQSAGDRALVATSDIAAPLPPGGCTWLGRLGSARPAGSADLASPASCSSTVELARRRGGGCSVRVSR